MTLPIIASRPARRDASTLTYRIVAAYSLRGEQRQATALSLLHELTEFGAPSEATIRSWSRIGSLLSACATSAAIAGDEARAARFAALARQSHDLWEASLAELCARRQVGRRVTSRVIDAACEVVS